MSRPNFRDLHKCANHLLHSPLIQQALAHHQQETSSVQEISETILRMLELCSTTRDLLVQVKQHLRGLQYISRRSILDGDMHLGAKVSADDNLGRKNLKKEIIKCFREFEGMKSKYFSLDLSLIDHNLIVVVHVLREVRMAAFCILESLLSLITLPTTQNQESNKGPLALKFMAINCQRLSKKCKAKMVRALSYKRLETMEMTVGGLEVELDCIFRHLIQIRVLLLNILTN